MAHHQGMSLLFAGLPAARSPHAAALSRVSCLQGRGPVAPGTCAENRRGCAGRGSGIGRHPRADGGARIHHARLYQSIAQIAGRSPALQWPLPSGHYQRGRRLQPLAKPGRHPVAGGCHPRLLGHLHLFARRRPRANIGPPRTNRPCAPPTSTRRSSRRDAPSSGNANPVWRSIRRSAFRRKTMSSCGASRSRTIPTWSASSS